MPQPFGRRGPSPNAVTNTYNWVEHIGRWTMKVLIVDDHVLFREGLSLLLRTLLQGVQIYEAGTVQAAVSQIAVQGGMDLILLDLGLPDMVGTEAIGYVREQHPDIPVVAL